MKRTKRNLKYSPKHRRMRLNETRYWPVAKAVLLFLLATTLVLFTIVVALPRVKKLFPQNAAVNGEVPVSASPAPKPVQKTPDTPVSQRLQDILPATLKFTMPEGISALADPFVFGSEILFSAGSDATGLTQLLRVDPAAETAEVLAVQPDFDALRNPVEDAAHLAFVDAKNSGGGAVRVLDKATGQTRTLCRLNSGVPKLYLDSPYLMFYDRLSGSAVRLVIWDLRTGMSVAPAVFTDPAYATSAPSLFNGVVAFADQDESVGSVVRTLWLNSGKTDLYDAETVVHDPQLCGNHLAWLSGAHGEDADLYLQQKQDKPSRIAKDVADYALTQNFIVYGNGETVYACAFDNDRTYILNAAGTSAQLAGASGSLILWRDVTNPSAPTWQYLLLG